MRIAIAEMSNEALLRQLLDALPLYLFLVDGDVTILDYNAAAAALLGPDHNQTLRKRGGEALNCIHSHESTEGCGRGTRCAGCPLRDAVKRALAGEKVVRSRVRLELVAEGSGAKDLDLLLTASPFSYKGHRRVVLMFEDLSPLVKLERLVPVCLKCHRVRDDEAYWSEFDDYLRENVALRLGRSLCPECERQELLKRRFHD